MSNSLNAYYVAEGANQWVYKICEKGITGQICIVKSDSLPPKEISVSLLNPDAAKWQEESGRIHKTFKKESYMAKKFAAVMKTKSGPKAVAVSAKKTDAKGSGEKKPSQKAPKKGKKGKKKQGIVLQKGGAAKRQKAREAAANA